MHFTFSKLTKSLLSISLITALNGCGAANHESGAQALKKKDGPATDGSQNLTQCEDFSKYNLNLARHLGATVAPKFLLMDGNQDDYAKLVDAVIYVGIRNKDVILEGSQSELEGLGQGASKVVIKTANHYIKSGVGAALALLGGSIIPDAATKIYSYLQGNLCTGKWDEAQSQEFKQVVVDALPSLVKYKWGQLDKPQKQEELAQEVSLAFNGFNGSAEFVHPVDDFIVKTVEDYATPNVIQNQEVAENEAISTDSSSGGGDSSADDKSTDSSSDSSDFSFES